MYSETVTMLDDMAISPDCTLWQPTLPMVLVTVTLDWQGQGNGTRTTVEHWRDDLVPQPSIWNKHQSTIQVRMDLNQRPLLQVLLPTKACGKLSELWSSLLRVITIESRIHKTDLYSCLVPLSASHYLKDSQHAILPLESPRHRSHHRRQAHWQVSRHQRTTRMLATMHAIKQRPLRHWESKEQTHVSWHSKIAYLACGRSVSVYGKGLWVSYWRRGSRDVG